MTKHPGQITTPRAASDMALHGQRQSHSARDLRCLKPTTLRTHSRGSVFVEPDRGLGCVLWPGAYAPTTGESAEASSLPPDRPQRSFRAGEDLDQASAPAHSSSQRRCMISGSSVDAVAPITSPCCWLSLSGPAVGAGGSRPAAQRPIGSRPLLVVSEPRLVVRKKDLGNKITPGAYPGLGEDVPQV